MLKKLHFSYTEASLIDLGSYTSCHRNTLILEERNTLYFISTQSRDCKENLFYLPPQLPTSIHKKSTRLYLRLQELQHCKYNLSPCLSFLDIFVLLHLFPLKTHTVYISFQRKRMITMVTLLGLQPYMQPPVLWGCFQQIKMEIGLINKIILP